jgi:cysteine desulfurase
MSGTTYLDHAATTPMRAEAVAAMLPHLSLQYANPSGSHRFAREARTAIDDAREVVARVIGCEPGEVVFTSGGTEADNTAILGTLALRGGTAVCPAAEHHAVLECVQRVGGPVVATLPTAAVDLEALAATLAASPEVSVVSVMAVNNEVGTINDLAAVGPRGARHAPQAVLHTDAVQAACWLDLRAITPHVDYDRRCRRTSSAGRRAWACSWPAAAHGSSRCSSVAARSASAAAARTTWRASSRWRRRCASPTSNASPSCRGSRRCATAWSTGCVAALPDVHETVPREHKVAGSAHLCIDGIENEALLFLLDEAGVCASAASACAAGAMEPSHVLAAMGVIACTGTGRAAADARRGHHRGRRRPWAST